MKIKIKRKIDLCQAGRGLFLYADRSIDVATSDDVEETALIALARL